MKMEFQIGILKLVYNDENAADQFEVSMYDTNGVAITKRCNMEDFFQIGLAFNTIQQKLMHVQETKGNSGVNHTGARPRVMQ